MLIKKIIAFILLLVLLVGLNGCGGGVSKKTLKEVLEKTSKNDFSTINIVKTINFPKNVSGMENDGNNKYILYSIKIGGEIVYRYCAVELKEKKEYQTYIKYTPAYYLWVYFQDKGTELQNVKNFQLVVENIIKNGISCFENEETAKLYVKQATDILGLISTREIIRNNLKSETEDYTILFVKDTAIPIYFAFEGLQQVYNWESFYPEAFYPTMDNESIAAMTYMYGPAYTTKNICVVYDENNKKVGTYLDLETAKLKLGVE